MRAALILTSLIVCASAWAGESKMNLTASTFKGTVSILTKATSTGGKYVRTIMRISQNDGKKLKVIQESTIDQTGRPIAKSQIATFEGSNTSQSITVEFDGKGAKYKSSVGKQQLETLVPYPEGKSVQQLSEFWVFRDKPKVGDVDQYWLFDLAKQDWVQTDCKYLGKKQIKVNGKLVSVHCMQIGETTSYTDDKGDPIQVDDKSIHMVRAK